MEPTHPASNLIMGTMRLGSWGAQFNAIQYMEVIETCLEAGINTFDLADIYGDYSTEGEFGKVVAQFSGLRDKIKLITKCGIRRVCDARPEHRIKSYDSGRAHIIASVHNSLRELQTDYLDVLLLHRPDVLMDPSEVADTFAELKESGRVREFGVSNFSPSQVALLRSKFPIQVHQVEASLLQLAPFQNGIMDQSMQLDMEFQAWSPLGGGKLFQPSKPESQEERVIEELTRLLLKYQAEPDQLLLAWLLRHPASIRPVLGTTRVERIKNAVAATRIKMEKEDWYGLWQASMGVRLP